LLAKQTFEVVMTILTVSLRW